MKDMPTPEHTQRVILEILARRQPGRTICPSEAARALVGDNDFRALMPQVRDAAAVLVASGDIEVMQSGAVIDPAGARGPIRLRLVR